MTPTPTTFRSLADRRAVLTPWLEQLRALRDEPLDDDPRHFPSPRTLREALFTLNIPEVFRHLMPLVNATEDVAALDHALAVAPVSSWMVKHASAKLADAMLLSPLGLVMCAAPSAPAGGVGVQVKTALMGALLALGAPVRNDDWHFAVQPCENMVDTPPPVEWLDLLLASGAPVPIPDAGNTLHHNLLTRMARYPHHWPDATVQALIEAGIPLDTNHYQGSAVMLAVMRDSMAPSPRATTPPSQGMLRLLLAAGANPSLPSASDGCCPIHWAMFLPHGAPLLRLLVDHGVDPRQVWVDDSEDVQAFGIGYRSNHHGRTPLHVLASTDHAGVPGILQALLDLGVPVNLPDEQGNTPLHVALLERKMTTAELLVAHGASLDAVNHAGQRPVNMLDNDELDEKLCNTFNPLDDERRADEFKDLTHHMRAQMPHLERLVLDHALRSMDLPVAPSLPRARL